MKNYKVYGNENTNLILSEKAEKAYDNTDPLRILEHDDGTYSVEGCFEKSGMTESELNAFLEELAEEIFDDE